MTPGGYNRGRRLEHDGQQLATQHKQTFVSLPAISSLYEVAKTQDDDE